MAMCLAVCHKCLATYSEPAPEPKND